jgi:hypothetical protein
VRQSLNTATLNAIEGPVPRISKLIVFVGVEAGARTEFCATGVAVRLARKRRCLAIELGAEAGILGKYLPLPIADRRMPEFLHDRICSLQSLKAKSRFTNIEFLEWESSPDIHTFAQLLKSDPAECVVATLTPRTGDKGMDVFCAAEVPVIVTRPAQAALERVFEFLRRLANHGSPCGAVQILLNMAPRRWEEGETEAWIEATQQDLGIPLSFLGSLTYDLETASNLHLVTPHSWIGQQGSTGSAFEDIAMKIERLLPTHRLRAPRWAKRPSAFFAGVNWPFGRRAKRLQEQLRQRDEFIARLQQQNIPPEELAEISTRISELENETIALEGENEQLRDEIDAAVQERDASRRIEVMCRREISELRAHLQELRDAIQKQARTLGMLEEANSRLKFEWMSAVENKSERPAPAALLEAREALIAMLRKHPPQSVTIVSSESAGSATFDFSIEMRSILESAGWTVKFMEGSLKADRFYGLQVINDGSEPSVIAARILCRAIEDAGFAFFERVAPAISNITPLRLLVGRTSHSGGGGTISVPLSVHI